MYLDIIARPSWPVISPTRRVLDALASRIVSGALAVTLPNGEQASYRGTEPGPTASIRIHRMRAFRRLLAGSDIGFAQSYLDGDWDSDDLVSLIELGARNEASLSQVINGRIWGQLLNRGLHLLRPNTKRGSRRNIAAHYDLGNEFYRLWLDPTMTYSAALFASAGESLESAQERKYARMAEIAGLRPEHKVLEIGCGWGGFCVWAARNIGCRVTAVTISQQQYNYTNVRVAAAGLSGRVEVRLQDYRDLEGIYDRVVSIEMLEAVGEGYWSVYFDTLRARLAPGGVAALQVITIDDAAFPAYRRRADFVQRYVFPGGLLPSLSALRLAVRRSGLTWNQDNEHGADYARTLAHWHRRFEQAWPQIATLGFDERFHRLWRYYLAYCEAGFRSRRIGLMQIGLSRP